jgi:hypothetical protein
MTLALFLIATGIAIFFYLLGFSAGQKQRNNPWSNDENAA